MYFAKTEFNPKTEIQRTAVNWW